jgi:hypothetical protein
LIVFPVILSPVRKAISNEPQVTEKKKKVKTLGFDAAEIKVKPRDAEIEIQLLLVPLKLCKQRIVSLFCQQEKEVADLKIQFSTICMCVI